MSGNKDELDGWEPIECKGCKKMQFGINKQEQSDGSIKLAYFCTYCLWTTEVKLG